jgi:hypothetical protein
MCSQYLELYTITSNTNELPRWKTDEVTQSFFTKNQSGKVASVKKTN